MKLITKIKNIFKTPPRIIFKDSSLGVDKKINENYLIINRYLIIKMFESGLLTEFEYNYNISLLNNVKFKE